MIVEDEPLAARRLIRLLAGIADAEIVAVVENGQAALANVETARPNLMLLDIEMPELDGFELLEKLPAGIAPAIVFVTAFDSYAHRAFDVRAVDFVLKPVAAERLASAIRNARRDLETRDVERKLAVLQEKVAEMRRQLNGSKSGYEQEFWVQQRSRRVRIAASDIDWIEADKDYVRIHSGPSSFMVLGLMAAVENRLDPDAFIRIHRSAIVRIDRVRSVNRSRYGVLDVELLAGTKVRVGRKYAARVRSRIAAGV
ncbi:MAG TPA: LytTR family DNA-binding domain-containing protein [Allosphingosinicella sp.]